MTAIRHSPDGARLRLIAGPSGASATEPDRPHALVLLVHGGDEDHNDRRVPLWWPPVLRMALLAPRLRRTMPGTSVHLLWNAVQGWNDGTAPVRDALWAVDELRAAHPGTPIVLVGHSMGGRVGARVLGTPGVTGLVGLAAWLPADEPLPDPQAAGLPAPIVLIHGDADGEVPIGDSRRWAARAGAARPGAVTFVTVPHGEHTMLRRAALWHRLAARGVRWVADSGR